MHFLTDYSMRVLHSNKRIRVFWHCPITAVAGKCDVSFSCQCAGEIFERNMAYAPAYFAGK